MISQIGQRKRRQSLTACSRGQSSTHRATGQSPRLPTKDLCTPNLPVRFFLTRTKPGELTDQRYLSTIVIPNEVRDLHVRGARVSRFSRPGRALAPQRIWERPGFSRAVTIPMDRKLYRSAERIWLGGQSKGLVSFVVVAQVEGDPQKVQCWRIARPSASGKNGWPHCRYVPHCVSLQSHVHFIIALQQPQRTRRRTVQATR